MNNFLNFK